MQKYKICMLSLIYMIFLNCDWLISNLPIIMMRKEEIFLEQDIFLNLFSSTNGYSGLLQELVIYSLLVLLGAYYLSYSEEPPFILRHGSRGKYRNNEVLQLLVIAMIFSGFHELINYLYVRVFFAEEIVSQFSYTSYSIFSAIFLLFFYLQVGILYKIFDDLIKPSICSILITFFLCLCQFWVVKFYLIEIWLPCQDLMISFKYLINEVSGFALYIAFARNSIIVICLYAVSRITFNQKDILKNEGK